MLCAEGAPSVAVRQTFALPSCTLCPQSGRGPRITGWYEDVSVYTAIYNILPYNKIVNVHDYIEYGVGKVRQQASSFCCCTHERLYCC